MSLQQNPLCHQTRSAQCVHTPDGSASTLSAQWNILTVQQECLAFVNSWLRQKLGLSGLCLCLQDPRLATVIAVSALLSPYRRKQGQKRSY